jgi:hypothetical protein
MRRAASSGAIFASKLGSKKKGMLVSVNEDFSRLRQNHSRHTRRKRQEISNIQKNANSPIIRPSVYHTVKSTLVKTIRPYLPHYHEAIRHQDVEYILTHVLSPILQTMHPGIGSAVIQIPSSIPSWRIVAPGFSTARNCCGKNTCRAPRVSSAHRKLPNSMTQMGILSLDERTERASRETSIVPEADFVKGPAVTSACNLTCGRHKKTGRRRWEEADILNSKLKLGSGVLDWRGQQTYDA